MPVISAYSSSGSSYITSSRYPKSSYSDRKYYPSLSSGGLSSYSSSSSSVGGGGGSGYGSGLHYRKSSYRYDLVPTFSPCAYLSRAEDRNTGSTYRVAQPTTSHQQGAAALSNSGISVAPTSYEDSISNSASASNKNTISNSSSSSSNSSSSSSTTTTTTTTTTTSGIGTSSLSRSNRYSSTYGGYGSSSLNRDHSYTRGSTSASGSSNSPGGSNYVSNLRNSALCGAELYQRYSLSTFKPAPSIVSRATSGSEIGSSSTSSTLASLRGSSPVVSSLDNSSGSKQLRTGTSTKGLSSTSSYRSSKDYDSAYRVSSSGSGSSGPHKSSYDTDYDVTDSVRGRKEGLCGLWNIGNTCFMNSIIQCLSHTRELTTFLRSQSSIERGANKDHRILAEYTKLLKDMWSGTQRSVNPSELKYAFSSKHRMYSGSAQQDAQEFLRFFLDTLHGALNVAVKRDPLGDIDDDMNNRVKADLLWNWYSKAENSMIKDLFVGQLRSTLKCTYCGTESTMFDPFWDLSLPLPSSNSRCKLESCLEMFIKEEILDGIDQPTCSKCNTRRKCTKSLTIERFPKYLVIHLKRFSETRWSKLTNVIEFPTGDRELNLQPYASEDNMGPVNYSLYGISNHMGSTAGGHYIAVCKHPITKEWNEFNDNFVSETTERSLVTSSAYVLFYERA
ncbi:ubiquitin carboxyl-terminal hydrolase Usp2-like isoform X4 [Anopheles aquasalis]|uniref:ubiquitin carboxyl-terminal hydrolase Usp2-like isoform X4 n=1 Tax=Anopheles aquasalis TaxID=42839 RepID=UPI00215A9195|nr:ubiquitin carboxyl-terminal hydrolase Usp2-like isoform X4 [Anopheles aquasalis]